MREKYCLNHRLNQLKEYTDYSNGSKKSVKSAPSVAIRDSDKVQQEINQYLTQLAK